MFASLVASALVSFATAAATPGFTWRDCGSTKATNTSVNITPNPQHLGQNWTIFYYFDLTETVPNVTGTYTAEIDATLDGVPVHKSSWDLCDVTNPIAKGDGLGECPYKSGSTLTIHDTNNLPALLPKSGYRSRFTITSTTTGSETWLCLDANQTYA